MIGSKHIMMLTLTAVIGLSACTNNEDRVVIDGVYHPGNAKSGRGDRQSFVVSVRRVEQGLDTARRAGAHYAARYCLKNYGTSEINWTIGPDADESVIRPSNGALKLSGECALW